MYRLIMTAWIQIWLQPQNLQSKHSIPIKPKKNESQLKLKQSFRWNYDIDSLHCEQLGSRASPVCFYIQILCLYIERREDKVTNSEDCALHRA